MLLCALVPVAQNVGVSRIEAAKSIPQPLGDSGLSPDDEFALRKEILKRALFRLTEKIDPVAG